MKKILTIVAALLAVLLVASCLSSCMTKGPQSAIYPKFIQEAVEKHEKDTMVGIGTSQKFGTLNQTRTTAITRARGEIASQINTTVQSMVRDYTAGSEVDPSAVLQFNEQISVTLTKADLTGAKVIAEGWANAKEENYWVAVAMDLGDIKKIVKQAVAAEKLAVPALASFNAEDRMDDAFAKAATR